MAMIFVILNKNFIDNRWIFAHLL